VSKGRLNFMFRSKRDKEKNRFYLLPGMGGRSHRRKQWFILKWSLVAALFFSAILSLVLYLIDRMNPH